MSKKHLLEGFASDLSQGFGHVYAILSKYLPHIPTKNAYPHSSVTQHKVPTYATYTTYAQHEYNHLQYMYLNILNIFIPINNLQYILRAIVTCHSCVQSKTSPSFKSMLHKKPKTFQHHHFEVPDFTFLGYLMT